MKKKLDLKVGYACNNNCFFCAQGSNRKYGDRTTAELKKSLEDAYHDGCTEVVFTGGEVTIRKDVFEIISMAKTIGYDIIQLQTNGRMFYYQKFCEDIISAGANQFSPALHGHIAEVHDYLTRSPGAWKQTTTGMRNLHHLGQTMVSNSVVVKSNYRYLPELAHLLVELGVEQFQMAFVHPCGNAMENFDSTVPYKTLAAPYVRQALQVGIDAGVKVMAEAVPYCLMKSYEKYVSEQYIPDTEVREHNKITPNFTKVRKEEGKVKFSQCTSCRFDAICEGPWKEYAEKRGNSEFQPVTGTKITKYSQLLNL